MNWNPKNEWSSRTNTFNVVISKHIVEASTFAFELNRDEGIHRWDIYVYIFPKHPLFNDLVDVTRIFDDKLSILPLHCGCSFLMKHYACDGSVNSIQIGCDYNHLYDNDYTFIETQEDAYSIFRDAEELYNVLDGYTKTNEDNTNGI